jgi:hypothetical protein
MLAAFTPWALLRLLPLHELAAGVEGMRGAGPRSLNPASAGAENAYERTQLFGEELAEARTSRPAAEAGEQSAARSAMAGLDTGHAGADGDPAPTDATDHDQAQAQPASPSATGPGDRLEPPPVDGRTGGGSIDGRSERVPGMAPPWQSANRTWPGLEIGPDTLPDAQLEPPARSPDPIQPPAEVARDLARETSLDPWPPPPAPQSVQEASLDPWTEPGPDDGRG